MTTLHTVLPPASDAKFVGDEPSWIDVEVPETRYNAEILRGLNWHNYCASEKDYIKYIEQWIRQYRPQTAKQDIVAWREFSDIRATVCIIARMQLQGFPLKDKHTQQICDYVDVFTARVNKNKAKTAAATTPTVVRPTIQDRIRAQVSQALSDLDVCIDEAFEGNIDPSDKIAGDILTHNFKGPQLKLVMEYLDKNISEWREAYGQTDDQLTQGYSYVGRRTFKKIIDTFSEVVGRISQQQNEIKVQRIRKKKPVDKKKLASKIRFMPTFEGIKSQAPVNIIGANVVWVYDTKSRRLGYYESEGKNGLYVKGTMICGFKYSCEKILRKPEEQLPDFMALRKNQTSNWFETIRAKCKDMTGRTNANLLILRID